MSGCNRACKQTAAHIKSKKNSALQKVGNHLQIQLHVIIIYIIRSIIMPQIIPIKDLKDTSKISEMCRNSNEPVFITKNGYGDMVMMRWSSMRNI